jgi:hypothetical protein
VLIQNSILGLWEEDENFEGSLKKGVHGTGREDRRDRWGLSLWKKVPHPREESSCTNQSILEIIVLFMNVPRRG